MRKVRGLWPVVVIATGTVWLALFVWRSPHRNDLAGFWSFVAAVVAVALVLIGGLISRPGSAGTRRNGHDGQGRRSNELADLLAASG